MGMLMQYDEPLGGIPEASEISYGENSNVEDEITNIKEDITQINNDLSAYEDNDLNDYTLLTFNGQLNTGQTYINTNIFTIPSTAKRVFFAFNKAGDLGGIVELPYGNQDSLAFTYGDMSRCLVSWASNVIHVSYAYMTAGGNVTYRCWYK